MLTFPYKKYFLTSDLEEKICVCVHFYPNHCETQGIFGNWLKLVQILMHICSELHIKQGQGFKMLTCAEDEDHIPSDA